MATGQEALERQLTRQELQDLRNKRTGLAIFQASWIMVFVCLVLVNLHLRGQSTTWPPPGVGSLEPLLPTAMTLLLIVSSFTARRGVRALKNEQLPAFLNQWRLTLILGVVFVVVMAYEWISVPPSGQYSNVFRLMVGFHGFHALAIGWYMWRVYRNAQAGRYDANHFWPVEGGASLWYFVTIAWIMFYAVLYVI